MSFLVLLTKRLKIPQIQIFWRQDKTRKMEIRYWKKISLKSSLHFSIKHSVISQRLVLIKIFLKTALLNSLKTKLTNKASLRNKISKI